MKANLVGTVIILSLVIWIPVSCWVSWKDRTAKRKETRENEWLSASVSRTLISFIEILVFSDDFIRLDRCICN